MGQSDIHGWMTGKFLQIRLAEYIRPIIYSIWIYIQDSYSIGVSCTQDRPIIHKNKNIKNIARCRDSRPAKSLETW